MEPVILCPRDRLVLPDSQGETGRRSCGGCGGIFLRNEAVKAALRTHGMDLEKCTSFLPVALDCPQCSGPMRGLVIDALVVDICDACHAVWLDKGELEKVSAYLERAELPVRHPPSLASADDFGILGGIASADLDRLNPVWDREKDAELIRELRDVLKRLF